MKADIIMIGNFYRLYIIINYLMIVMTLASWLYVELWYCGFNHASIFGFAIIILTHLLLLDLLFKLNAFVFRKTIKKKDDFNKLHQKMQELLNNRQRKMIRKEERKMYGLYIKSQENNE